MTARTHKAKSLPVDSLVLDGGTQSRAAVSETTVEEYADVLEVSGDIWPFPPLVVFHDGNRNLLAGGFHRTLAARRVGWKNPIPCEVRQGTAWDALLYGMGDNLAHGLRPTREDRRRNVELLLDSGKKLTQEEIASITGAGLRTVKRIVAERKPQPAPEKVPMAPSARRTDPEKVPLAPSGSDDADPFDVESDSEPSWDAPPPAVRRNGTEAPPEPSGRDEFGIQRAKTVKTIEALMRAFDDLNGIRPSMAHKAALTACKGLLERARNW